MNICVISLLALINSLGERLSRKGVTGAHDDIILSLQRSVLQYSPVVKAKFFSCTTCTNSTSGHVAKFSTAKENSYCH